MIVLLLRALGVIAILAALAVGGALLIESEGRIAISFAGVDYPSLTVVEALALLAAATGAMLIGWKLVGLVFAVVRWLLGDRAALDPYFGRTREKKGLEALSRGMIALAQGEPQNALPHARRAQALLGPGEATALLQAQIAEASGDAEEARRHYRQLARHKTTATVGVRGLLAQAVRSGETDKALAFAQRAFELRPKDRDVQQTLFELQVRKADWPGALATLAAMVRARHLPKDVARRREALLDLEAARVAHEAGDRRTALDRAEAAAKAAPAFAPAVAFAARMWGREHDVRQATRLLVGAWRQAPHPDLAAAFAAIEDDDSPRARRRRFRELLNANPDDPETRLLAAELAIADHDFRGARQAMEDLAAEKPSHRSLTIMAAIEKGEGGSEQVIRAYLARAVTAPRGAHWTCDRCGAQPAEWTVTCAGCGGFDTLVWREEEAAPETLDAALLPLMIDDADVEESRSA
ncbi:MAG: heme biosynthesis protein HemY [Rhodobacteraceae bacterium]|nr:MAG: heme biosynthesis protein HemY [Paracoccaceae bacterium]